MKKFLTYFLAFTLVLSLAVSAFSAPASWAEPAVNRAVGLGLVPAALQSNYSQNITRAEFCALAVAVYEAYTGGAISERGSFEDTNDINISKMAGLGVVQGVGNNKFNPAGIFDRQMAAVLTANLLKAMEIDLPKEPAAFADNNRIAPWALEAVGQVQAAGIMVGIGNNMFAPLQAYSREQGIATMIEFCDFVAPALGRIEDKTPSTKKEQLWWLINAARGNGEFSFDFELEDGAKGKVTGKNGSITVSPTSAAVRGFTDNFRLLTQRSHNHNNEVDGVRPIPAPFPSWLGLTDNGTGFGNGNYELFPLVAPATLTGALNPFEMNLIAARGENPDSPTFDERKGDMMFIYDNGVMSAVLYNGVYMKISNLKPAA